MASLQDVTMGRQLRDHIVPLFWQHAEDETVLREEMEKMNGAGITSCIIESRPHPDFLGPLWWRDLDIIMDEARKRSMRIYVFDDSKYPSGYVDEKISAIIPTMQSCTWPSVASIRSARCPAAHF